MEENARPRRLLVLRPESTGAAVSNLWIVTQDGKDVRRITTEPSGVLDYTIAPDGSQIAYTTPDGNAATALWIMDIDSRMKRRLTPESDRARYEAPAWGPAGDLILYVRHELTSTILHNGPAAGPGVAPVSDAGKIWVVTPHGTQSRRIYGRGDEVGEAPIWAPDGSHIAFRETFPQTHMTNIVITDLLSDPVKVTTNTLTWMSWSPDSQWLTYDEAAPGAAGKSRIMFVRADGTAKRSMPEGGDHDRIPVWSVDQNVLAFLRRPSDDPRRGSVASTPEVWSATPEGRAARRLFGGDGLASEEPRWSPDGQMMLATRYTVSGPPQRGLWIVNADGSNAHLLLTDATRASWLPQRLQGL